MIYSISSSLSSFKSLKFNSGLNVLIAQKESGATEKQTRNRAGKTSLIEIIHFLTGAKADKASLFRSDALIDHSFEMALDIAGRKSQIIRSGQKPSKVDYGGTTITN